MCMQIYIELYTVAGHLDAILLAPICTHVSICMYTYILRLI
jgi:hypothetical protein